MALARAMLGSPGLRASCAPAYTYRTATDVGFAMMESALAMPAGPGHLVMCPSVLTIVGQREVAMCAQASVDAGGSPIRFASLHTTVTL